MRAEGCTSCGAARLEGARFCPSCGAPQHALCVSCGAVLPDGARFCAECGAPTGDPSRPPAAAVVSERRLTSVLFADLVGFTTFSEPRDPEQVREMLSRYFERAREVVARYDGVVEKFIGDAVMAVWGVPAAHEDDAERAVRAGQDLVDMVRALGQEIDAPLELRVGIVTGEVAVTIGATAEGMVAGDSVNTASRVQSAASPGKVWVDAATRSLTSHVVEYDDVGDHALKGKAEPVRLYAVRAVHAERDDVDALVTPLVGRERELGMLQQLFSAAVVEQRPRLLLIDGEAGVGKSRLVREFELWLDGLPSTTRWHRGRCLSYGDGVAFWALAEMARTRLGLMEGDAGPIVADRVDEWLARTLGGTGEAAHLRGPLLALVGRDAGGAVDRSQLFAAWIRFFELVGGGDPVVLVIDDAHHADDGLLDFVDQLLSTTRSAIVVVAMARSELLQRRPGWGGRRCAVVPLEPLGPDSMARLIDSLVQGVPADVRDSLAARTGGLPLFAVETVRALADQGLVQRDARGARVIEQDRLQLDQVDAPASLRGLVTSRLDSLPDDERRVVTDAAVLGLSFTLDGLAALGPPGISLPDVVGALLRRELFAVDDDRFSGERGQLHFVHAVVRQVAYGVLSRRERKTRHLAAADYLAGQVDDSGDVDAVVAQHLVDALDASFDDDPDVDALRARAAWHTHRAAERAHRLGAPGQASRLFERAGDLLADPGESARALVAAADSATDAGEQDRGVVLARRAADAFEGLGDLRSAAAAYAALARALSWSGRYPELRSLVEECLPRVEAVPDSDKAAFTLLERLSLAYANVGPMEKAAEIYQQLMERGLASDDVEMRISGYIARAALCENAEDWLGAVDAYERVIELSRVSGDSARIAVSLNNSSAVLVEIDLEKALARIREAVDEARRAGLRNLEDFSRCGVPEMLHNLGRVDEMVATVEALDTADLTTNAYYIGVWSEALCERISGHRFPRRPFDRPLEGNQPRFLQGLALIEWAMIDGRHGDAVAAASRVLGEAREELLASVWTVVPQLTDVAAVTDDAVLRSELLGLAAGTDLESCTPMRRAWTLMVHEVLGPEEPAESRAADAFDELGAVGFAAKTRALLGLRLATAGRADEARGLLDDAAATYRRIGADGWLEELERARSR